LRVQDNDEINRVYGDCSKKEQEEKQMKDYYMTS